MKSLKEIVSRIDVGRAILSGIESLPHPYVLFDHRGRLRYGNPPFFRMFGEAAREADIYALLRDQLGIDEFSRTYVGEEMESLCIGFLHQEDGPPLTYDVRGSKTQDGEEALFQCIITPVRPAVALQIGIRDLGMKDTVKLAQFVGSIAVEMDPEETGQHLLRTSRRLDRLGRAMRASGAFDLTDAEIDEASACSVLHDVGKMSLPPGILHKAEQLTEIDWSIIKSHVVAGLTLADTLKLPRAAVDIIAYHHCRWDGVPDRWDGAQQRRDPVRGGYPFCAQGPAIPVWARAFAYVDIYDALVTPRSYKPAWDASEAVSYIRDTLVGSQLDPGIFPAFLQTVGEAA